MSKDSLFSAAYACLMTVPVADKIRRTHQVYACWQQGELSRAGEPVETIKQPGRPDQPPIVAVKELARRNFHSAEGHAALMHAIAHIEYNAIDLAWDAVYRFQDMPEQYYHDWVRIAHEEARHFELIQAYLTKLGYQYGDFPAHSGLWDMAVDTEYDVLVRMALVPRVMEARGLDVTPGMMQKLTESGFPEAADILAVIYREEHGHVAVGNHWFHYLCTQRQLSPLSVFKDLIRRHAGGKIRRPINDEARRASGFSEEELLYLHSVI